MRDDTTSRPRAIGWELLRILHESLRSLEETASRVLAAQAAGAYIVEKAWYPP